MENVIAPFTAGLPVLDAAPATVPAQPTVGRPRILYVASTRHYGGLEVASIRLAELLMRTQPLAQEILFACRPGFYVDKECHALGIPTVPLTVRNSGDLSGVRHLVEIVQSERIDIIHVHSRRDYVTAALAKMRLRKADPDSAPKLIFHMHLLRHLGSPQLISGFFFAPNVDRFIAVSVAVEDFLKRMHRQLTADQVVVVPNSVDVDRFRLDPVQGAAIRAAHGIPADATVIGMVGRLDTKGQNEAIKALSDLKNDNAYLLLVGKAGINNYAAKLTRLARRKGVERQVIFCGPRDDVQAHLSAMDLFLHLPVDEAFGLAPAEAMSAGLPVIVSNVGGCKELVRQDETGVLVHPRRPKEISARLRTLIASPELRRSLGEAGSSFVRARYTTEAQASILSRVYRDVLQKGNAAQPTDLNKV